jgi:hypothetical protein
MDRQNSAVTGIGNPKKGGARHAGIDGNYKNFWKGWLVGLFLDSVHRDEFYLTLIN